MARKEVSATGGAVGTAKHRVRAHVRLSLVKGDFPAEAQHLDVLLDRDLPVILPVDLVELQQRAC